MKNPKWSQHIPRKLALQLEEFCGILPFLGHCLRLCRHPKRWICGDLGDPSSGGDSSAVRQQLQGVQEIQVAQLGSNSFNKLVLML
jgi:hypothetical protein